MELEYKIITTAELAGAEAAAEALERQIGKAKALKQDYSGLDAQLKTIRGSLDEHKKGLEDSSNATEGLNKHVEGSRMLFGELDRIVPGLGHAIHAAFSGPVGAAFGLAAVVYEVKHALDETSAALDEMGAKAAEHDFLPGIEAKLEVLRNAVGAAASYANKLADIKNGEHGVAEELTKQLALDQAIERARASLISAEKGLAIAQIQKKESLGQMDPEQAALARANVEKNSILQEQSAHEAAQNQELQRKQAALDEAQKRQRNLETDRAAAAEALAKFSAHQVQVGKDFGNSDKYNKESEEALKKLEAAEQKLAKVKNDDILTRPIVYPKPREQLIEEAETEAQMARARYNLIQRGRRQYEQSINPAMLSNLEDASKTSRDRALENSGTIGKLTDQIAELTRVIGDTRPIEREATRIKTQTVDTTADANRAENFSRRITEDFSVAERDIHSVGNFSDKSSWKPQDLQKAQKEWAEASAKLQDAAGIIPIIQGMGKDMSKMAEMYKELKTELSQVRHTANLNIGGGF
ncbi:MAG: hypothetical protein WCH99_04305 [Verrucomicrobiota bacterium]